MLFFCIHCGDRMLSLFQLFHARKKNHRILQTNLKIVSCLVYFMVCVCVSRAVLFLK